MLSVDGPLQENVTHSTSRDPFLRMKKQLWDIESTAADMKLQPEQ